MKNFSLKALGASLLTAGLVLAGVVAPAQAGAFTTLVASPTSSQALGGSTSPSLTLSADGSPAGFRYLIVGFVNGSGNGLSPNATCMSTPTWANCGISGVTLTSTAVVEADAPVSIINLGGRNYLKITWAADVSGQPSVDVALAAGAFLMGNYSAVVDNNFNAYLSYYYDGGNGAGGGFATGNTIVRTAPPAITPQSISINGSTQTSSAFTATGFSSGPTYSTNLTITGFDFSTSTGRYTRNSATLVATTASGTITASGSMGQTATATVSVNIPAPTSYTANFLANGGSGNTMSQQSSSSGSITMPTSTYTKTGYTFAGWRAGSATVGTIYQAGDVAPLTMNNYFFAQWTVNGGGGGSAPTVNMSLNATTGQLVAGSTVAVVASGLQTTAPYTVVVQSTPQTIGTGNATAGAVNTSVTLPAGLEAGWHTLTFSSTASDGSTVTSVSYFKVSASGTLLATSSSLPAELAYTGSQTKPILWAGLLLAILGAAILLIARRKFSN